MEWISVKDRLPIKPDKDCDEYDELIVHCSNNPCHENIVTSLDFTEHGWADQKGQDWNRFVTHWMPLPEPPKE